MNKHVERLPKVDKFYYFSLWHSNQ